MSLMEPLVCCSMGVLWVGIVSHMLVDPSGGTPVVSPLDVLLQYILWDTSTLRGPCTLAGIRGVHVVCRVLVSRHVSVVADNVPYGAWYAMLLQYLLWDPSTLRGPCTLAGIRDVQGRVLGPRDISVLADIVPYVVWYARLCRVSIDIPILGIPGDTAST